MEQVCNFLPASVKHTCDAFVAQYTPELIQLLLQLKPAQACTYLRLCSSKGKSMTCSLCGVNDSHDKKLDLKRTILSAIFLFWSKKSINMTLYFPFHSLFWISLLFFFFFKVLISNFTEFLSLS